MLNNFPTDCELLIASIFGRIKIIDQHKYSIKRRAFSEWGLVSRGSRTRNSVLIAVMDSRRFTIFRVFVEQSGKLCLEILREEIWRFFQHWWMLCVFNATDGRYVSCVRYERFKGCTSFRFELRFRYFLQTLNVCFWK